MALDLALVWALLVAFAVLAYVVLDGFDLGIGILFPWFRRAEERDLLSATIAPVWDGNETWLILGGGGLFAAFPLAYAVLMPALYVPVLAMLLALVFRGVAFEFRWRARSRPSRRVWDGAFLFGSAIAAFAQGAMLGAILQGIEVADRSFAGGPWDWASAFSALTGLAVVAGYALLGACWLVIKTTGAIQARARRIGRALTPVLVGFIAAVSLVTPLLEPVYWEHWFTWPGVLLAALAPALVALLAWRLWVRLGRGRRDWAPMLLTLGLFLVTFVGLGVSIWPYAVPTGITIWDAATSFRSQIFMFVGAAVLIPIILGYTAYAYWVFRGKLEPGEGSH
jgi:cytochrome d ubiquinol oxidase subunit II